MGCRKYLVIGFNGDGDGMSEYDRWADSYFAKDAEAAIAKARVEYGDDLIIAGVVALSKTGTIEVVA